MAKPTITIIGLGVSGASLGMALRQQETRFEVIGHDKDMGTAQAARKAGAVHKTEWNLYSAIENTGMIVVAVPLSEFDGLFELIAEELEPSTMILAISSVMEPVLQLAAKHFPDHANFVAGHPVLTGIGGSLQMRADLYKEVVFALAPGLQTDPNAVQLASDFIERIDAQPFFVDAHEHDGVMAGVEHLPLVMAASLVRTSIMLPSWREAQRLAGRRFAQASEVGQNAEQLFSTFRTNRANLLHRIDQLSADLAEWRALLETDPPEGEEHPLLARLEEVVKARDAWETQAMLQNWDESGEPPPQVETPGLFRQMLFGNLMNRKSSSDSEKSK